jgi:formate dehydrogenase maturation protein FdhE
VDGGRADTSLDGLVGFKSRHPDRHGAHDLALFVFQPGFANAQSSGTRSGMTCVACKSSPVVSMVRWRMATGVAR